MDDFIDDEMRKTFPKIDFDFAFNSWIVSGIHHRDFWVATGYHKHLAVNALYTLGSLNWIWKLRSLIKKNPDSPHIEKWKATAEAKAGKKVEPRSIKLIGPGGRADLPPLDELPAAPLTSLPAIRPKEENVLTRYFTKPIDQMDEREISEAIYLMRTKYPAQSSLDCAEDLRVLEEIRRNSYMFLVDETTGVGKYVSILSVSDHVKLIQAKDMIDKKIRMNLGLSTENVASMVSQGGVPDINIKFLNPTKQIDAPVEATVVDDKPS